MSKEIICVYQDCYLCGDRGKPIKELIFKKKLNVRKVSFASPEGRELIHKAITEHKIGKMPFFYCEGSFSLDLNDFIGGKKKEVKRKESEDADLGRSEGRNKKKEG